MKQSKIIFLLNNVYGPDSRVENEINALIAEGGQVDLYCVSSPKLPKHEDLGQLQIYRWITPQLYRPFSNEYRDFVKKFCDHLSTLKGSVIHCHDFQMFFLGCKVKVKNPSIKLIYDSHEYLLGYPYFYRIKSLKAKFKGFFVWLYYVSLEIILLKKTDAIITVSESLRQKFERRSGKASILVRNIPPKSELCVENCTYWHKTYNLSPSTKVIVHTGNAFFSKKRLLLLLRQMESRNNLALVFLGSNKSLVEIRRICWSRRTSNVFFHEQVPRKYVPYYCSQANFGLVYTWNPAWKSYWFALPNKLMDVSLAGIPVLSTNQPELLRFISEHKNGICFSGRTMKDLDKALDEILAREVELKRNAVLVRDTVNWELESQKLIGVYKNLISE